LGDGITEGGKMRGTLSLFFRPVVVGAVLGSAALAQDALLVNDENLRIRFENDRVRVLERTLQPGGREKEHSHPAYLIYVVRGGKLRDHNADGKVAEVEVKDGDVLYRDPKTHWAENIGTTVIDVIVVELKVAKPGDTH
jgi:quercetin dioxygenase-like cupin family protein